MVPDRYLTITQGELACSSMIRRMSKSLAFAAVALLAVTGCSSSDADPTASASGTPTSAAPAAPAGAAPAASGTVAAPSVGTGSAAAGSIPVIIEQIDLPAVDVTGKLNSGDTVTAGIRSLTVDPNGKTMTLRLVFTPRLGSKQPTDKVRLYDLFVGTSLNFAPYLLDRTNLKRYDMIRSEGAQPMASDLSTGGVNGGSFEAWAVYAAPQDPVTSLEVSVRDNWAPFTNVPVSR